MNYSLKLIYIVFLVSISMCWTVPSGWSQEVRMPFTEIYQKSGLILHVQVESSQSEWINGNTGRNIVTSTRFRVIEGILGNSGNQDTFYLEVPGGTIGDTTQYVSTSVAFYPGEEIILFLNREPLFVTGGYQGKLLIDNGMVYIEDQIIKSSELIQSLKKSVSDDQAIPGLLKKIKGESFFNREAIHTSQIKSGQNTTTNTYSVNGKISDFVGETDANGDGFFESFSFKFGIDGNADPGPDSVCFIMFCVTTGQSWISDNNYAIEGNTEDYRYFNFTEALFSGNISGNTSLDFKVEMWDTLKTTLLASDSSIDNEPVKIGLPIPPSVIISSITPDQASAGTNSLITINGSNFGTIKGTGKVEFFYRLGLPKIPAQITSWTDNQIVCNVPIGSVQGYPGSAGSGPVTVTASSGMKSNGFPFRVTFGYGGVKWPNSPVLYRVNENYAGITGEGQAIQNGANSWNGAHSNFMFQYDGPHSNNTASRNSINEILWGTLNTSSLAESSMIISNGYIVECDIVYNANINWTTTPGVPSLSYDIESSAVHELGHWLNLRDLYGTLDGEYDQQKILFGFSYADRGKRDLHPDDVAGITWIYGQLSSVTVSGFIKTVQQVAVPDVTLSGLPGTPATNSQGFYSAIVPYGWTGIVNPIRAGYLFSPASRDYSNLTGNMENQDYSATILNADASLSDLRVNGITVPGFIKTTLNYTVQLPFGTTAVPVVTAFTTDIHATKIISPASSLPGSTTVEVTAQNGTTKQVYTVTFTLAAASTDATLSDLKVNGITVTGFEPAIFSYTIVLPHGTTAVPAVTATANFAGAFLEITTANSLPGSTEVRVTAQDGSTQNTYSIEFQVAKNDDATLSALLADGVPVTGYDKTILTYQVELPFGSTIVPVVTATSTDPNATLLITPATSLPGITTVEVTAENGTATQTYSIEFQLAPPSADASLSDLRIDGIPLIEFDPAIKFYDRTLPYGTTLIPPVTASANHPEASLLIYPAASLPGITSVVVTAQNGTTNATYSISFTVAKNNDATLATIEVAGSPIPGFSKYILNYNQELPYGTTVVPAVTALAHDGRATIVISPASVLPGSTSIKVTAEDNITKLEYGVFFSLAPPSADATLASLTIEGQPFPDFSPARTTYYMVLPHGTAAVPVLSATVTFPEATAVITPATTLPGMTIIVVTAQDGITKVAYVINFAIAKNTDATLSRLMVSGNDISNFKPDSLFYEYVVSSGTIEVPVVTALSADNNATVIMVPALSIPDTTRITVIAEDGISAFIYEVSFRYPLVGIDDQVIPSEIRVYPNPNNGNFTIEYLLSAHSSVRLSLVDLFGRMLYDLQAVPEDRRISKRVSLPGLPPGAYFIRLIDGSRVSYRKIVIE